MSSSRSIAGLYSAAQEKHDDESCAPSATVEDRRLEARKQKNRLSAAAHRDRIRSQIDLLMAKVASLESDNVSLRKRLSRYEGDDGSESDTSISTIASTSSCVSSLSSGSSSSSSTTIARSSSSSSSSLAPVLKRRRAESEVESSFATSYMHIQSISPAPTCSLSSSSFTTIQSSSSSRGTLIRGPAVEGCSKKKTKSTKVVEEKVKGGAAVDVCENVSMCVDVSVHAYASHADDELDFGSLVDMEVGEEELSLDVLSSSATHCRAGASLPIPQTLPTYILSSTEDEDDVGEEGEIAWASVPLARQMSFPDMALLLSRFRADGDDDALEMSGI